MTSLTSSAPSASARRATADLAVSIETGTSPSRRSSTGTTRRNSSSSVTPSEPGRVDSPPTSTIAAPSSSMRRAVTAAVVGIEVRAAVRERVGRHVDDRPSRRGARTVPRSASTRRRLPVAGGRLPGVISAGGSSGAALRRRRRGALRPLVAGVGDPRAALREVRDRLGHQPHDATHLFIAAAGFIALGIVESVAGALRHYFAIRNRGRGQASVRDGIFHHVAPARRALSRPRRRGRADEPRVERRRARRADARRDGPHDRLRADDLRRRIVLLVLDPILALVVLVPLPFIAFGFWRYSSRYAESTAGCRRSSRTRPRSSRRRSRAFAS